MDDRNKALEAADRLALTVYQLVTEFASHDKDAFDIVAIILRLRARYSEYERERRATIPPDNPDPKFS